MKRTLVLLAVLLVVLVVTACTVGPATPRPTDFPSTSTPIPTSTPTLPVPPEGYTEVILSQVSIPFTIYQESHRWVLVVTDAAGSCYSGDTYYTGIKIRTSAFRWGSDACFSGNPEEEIEKGTGVMIGFFKGIPVMYYDNGWSTEPFE